jgi:hypothetical protein
MANGRRNALVILHYQKEICRGFCSYLGKVQTNYLMPDIVKGITNGNKA